MAWSSDLDTTKIYRRNLTSHDFVAVDSASCDEAGAVGGKRCLWAGHRSRGSRWLTLGGATVGVPVDFDLSLVAELRLNMLENLFETLADHWAKPDSLFGSRVGVGFWGKVGLGRTVSLPASVEPFEIRTCRHFKPVRGICRLSRARPSGVVRAGTNVTGCVGSCGGRTHSAGDWSCRGRGVSLIAAGEALGFVGDVVAVGAALGGE